MSECSHADSAANRPSANITESGATIIKPDSDSRSVSLSTTVTTNESKNYINEQTPENTQSARHNQSEIYYRPYPLSNISYLSIMEDIAKLNQQYDFLMTRLKNTTTQPLTTQPHTTQPLTTQPLTQLNYTNKFLIEKMEPNAFEITKANNSDAGYDLRAYSDGIVPAWSSKLVNTKIKVSLPNNHYGRIASRSGLALKHNIEVGAGVVDNGYYGEILVLLRNFSDNNYEYKAGDKIAQFIITPYATVFPNLVDNIQELMGVSDRGANGFGSSGK